VASGDRPSLAECQAGHQREGAFMLAARLIDTGRFARK